MELLERAQTPGCRISSITAEAWELLMASKIKLTQESPGPLGFSVMVREG